MPSHRPIVIFSGGTAANHLVDIFESIRKSKECPLSYIIPISDNGGSSSELIRVFGGPGIGDVRSRLIRLIPRLPVGSPGFRERESIRSLFNHRLSSTDARLAKMEWADVVDGTSVLWKDISSAKKELIRSFFNLVNSEITKRSRPPNSTFDFTSASVGNLFITGARLFSGSFESAIYLLSSVCGIEDEGVKVIPSINSTFSHHIAAGLEDGTVIVGQNAISHPSPEAVPPIAEFSEADANVDPCNILIRRSSKDHYYGDEQEEEGVSVHEEEDANLPGTLPTLRLKNIKFNKDAHLNEDLPARISRIWYINPYGQEILPPANPRAVAAINDAQAVIYSIGSLYTSMVPSLVLKGIGQALRRNTSTGGTALRAKILILNGSLDREVGPQPPHPGAGETQFSAVDFVEAIVRACEQSRGILWGGEQYSSHDTTGISTPEKVNTNSGSTPAEVGIPASKTRPGLLSSKSEYLLRTSHRFVQRNPTHLFPPPLPASTATSRIPSREPSPSPPPSSSHTTFDSEDALRRSNSTIDAVASLPYAQSPARLTSETTYLATSNSRESKSTFMPTNLSLQHNIDPIFKHYVTHLIHLPNSPFTPHVDKDVLLSKYGIQCVKVYGRSDPDGQGMRYDAAALRGAIEVILGRRVEGSSRPGTACGRKNERHTSKDLDHRSSVGAIEKSTGTERDVDKSEESDSDLGRDGWDVRSVFRRNTLNT